MVAHSSAVRPRAWSDRHGSAGIAGGALDGGDHHRSGRGRAAGLVKVPQVGGEARVVERSALEPGVELAAGHGVGAAGVGRRRALDEPDRGLDAGPLDIGADVPGLAGGTYRMIRLLISPIRTASIRSGLALETGRLRPGARQRLLPSPARGGGQPSDAPCSFVALLHRMITAAAAVGSRKTSDQRANGRFVVTTRLRRS